jgi:hypothetical protein
MAEPYVHRIDTQVVFWQGVQPSETLANVYRSGVQSRVSVSREAWEDKLPDVVDEINKIILMSLGVFVIARGRGRLAILAGLALYGLAAGAGIRPALIDMPAPLVIAVHVVRQVLLAGGLFFLTLLSVEMLRAASRNGSARAMRPSVVNALLIVALLIAMVVLGTSLFRAVVYPLYHTLNVIGPHDQRPLRNETWRLYVFLPPAIAMIVPLGIMFAAVARASRSKVGLYRWIFASTALGLSGTIIWLLSSARVDSRHLVPLVLTEIIMGVGYGYAIVRHRLVDVAFVINRTVALGLITFVIAVVIWLIDTTAVEPALLRWSRLDLSWWFKFLVYAAGFAVGLTLRFTEPRVETWIDRLLFARRYRIRQGLTRLRTDSREADSAAGLIHLVTSQLRGLIGARGVALYERDGQTYVPTHVDVEEAHGAAAAFAPLQADDQAILRIRSNLAPSEAAGLFTALPSSAVAFPMAPGGHFMGAVVVDRQSTADAYDPDLRALIGNLILEFAAALLYLRSAST